MDIKELDDLRHQKQKQIKEIQKEIEDITGKIFELEYGVKMGSMVEITDGNKVRRGIIHPDNSVCVYMYHIKKDGQLNYSKTYVYGSDFKSGKAKVID